MSSDKSRVRVGVLGSKNVGKTVVIHRLLYKEKEFKTWLGQYESIPTKGEEFVGNDFHFVEVGGTGTLQARQHCIYHRESDFDCFLVVFSIDEKSSVDNVVKKLVPEIKENLLFNAPIILLLNKSDLIPPDIVGKVDAKIRSFVQDQNLHQYLKLSNKTGEGYKQLYKCVKSLQGKGRSVPLLKTKQYVDKENELAIRRTKAITKQEGNELMWYSFHGDIQRVRELIADGANTNMIVPMGSDSLNPFSAAVMNNQLEVVNELMVYPEINLNHFDIDGETVLTYACTNKYLGVLDKLLRSQKIKIDEKNKMFYNVAEVLAAQNDPDTREVWERIKGREKLYHEGLEQLDLLKVRRALYDPNFIAKVEIREKEIPDPNWIPPAPTPDAPKEEQDTEALKEEKEQEDEMGQPPVGDGQQEEEGEKDQEEGKKKIMMDMDMDIGPPPPEEEGEHDEEAPKDDVPPEGQQQPMDEKKPEVQEPIPHPMIRVKGPVLVIEEITENPYPISPTPLINIDCKNENGESAMEVALKTGDNTVIMFLFGINGTHSRIRVEKDMVKLCQDMKEEILTKKTAQTIQSVFVELLKGEKRYLEKLLFLNRFYLRKLRLNVKKLVKKSKLRKDLIAYADLILELKKTSAGFLEKLMKLTDDHYRMIRDGKQIENMELLYQYKVVDLLRSVNFKTYLQFFEEDVLLSSDIKEEEHFAELHLFLKECQRSIPLLREKANAFFAYTLNIKDRVMAYQNLLGRVLKTSDPESNLHKKVNDTLTFIIKSIREFDDKVKNEKNMRKVEVIMKTRYQMDSIAQNKKRKYVHHQVDMDVLEVDGSLISGVEKTKKKKKKKKKKSLGGNKYSIFLFSDLMVFASEDELYIFFFHDTKSVFVFNSKNVQVKIFSSSKDLLLEVILGCSSSKVISMHRNMEEYYYLSLDNYYIPKISLINNLKLEQEVEEFLKYDKNNVMDIVMYKRDLLAQKKKMLEQQIEDIEREDEVFIGEIKELRERSMNQNQMKIEAHKMMQKYNPEKNVKNSPLVIKF